MHIHRINHSCISLGIKLALLVEIYKKNVLELKSFSGDVTTLQ